MSSLFICDVCDNWATENEPCPYCALRGEVDALRGEVFRLRHSMKQIHDEHVATVGWSPHEHPPCPGMPEGREYATCFGLMADAMASKGREQVGYVLAVTTIGGTTLYIADGFGQTTSQISSARKFKSRNDADIYRFTLNPYWQNEARVVELEDVK